VPSAASAANPSDSPERRMRMNRLADIDGVGAHLDRQCEFADQVAGVRADDTAADDPVGVAVEEQFGEPFVPSVRDGAPRCAPREQTLRDFPSRLFCFVFSYADPRDLRIGVGPRTE